LAIMRALMICRYLFCEIISLTTRLAWSVSLMDRTVRFPEAESAGELISPPEMGSVCVPISFAIQ
jgi:hypothetical protein